VVGQLYGTIWWSSIRKWYLANLLVAIWAPRRSATQSFRHCFSGFGFKVRVRFRVRARSVRHSFRAPSAAVIVFSGRYCLQRRVYSGKTQYRGKISRPFERLRVRVPVLKALITSFHPSFHPSFLPSFLVWMRFSSSTSDLFVVSRLAQFCPVVEDSSPSRGGVWIKILKKNVRPFQFLLFKCYR